MGSGAHGPGSTDRLTQASMVFAHTMLEYLGHCAGAVGLPKQQAYALHLLVGEPELSMSELGERLGADPSTVSGLVDRLAGRGLIERHQSTDDRRVKRLTVTELGHRLDAELETLIHASAPGTAGLTPQEQATLAGLLERVVAEAHAQEPCRRAAR